MYYFMKSLSVVAALVALNLSTTALGFGDVAPTFARRDNISSTISEILTDIEQATTCDSCQVNSPTTVTIVMAEP